VLSVDFEMLLLSKDPFAYWSQINFDRPARYVRISKRARVLIYPRKKRPSRRFLNPLSAVPI